MNRSLQIHGARIVAAGRMQDGATLTVEDGKIVSVTSDADAPETEHVRIDGASLTVLPGFVDVHIHGGGGADTMDATPEALRTICRTHARFGTTSLLATTMTEEPERITNALRNARAAVEAGLDFCSDGAQVVGIHLEGPYISPKRAGAQPKEWVRPYDADEFAGWLEAAGDTLRLITLAPDEPGASDLISACRAAHIAVSLGHTDASAEQARAAVAEGATHATHLFNAMPPLHHRAPGAVAALLTEASVKTEIIADGHHVAPDMIRLALAAKLVQGIVLVTDAIAGAGAPEGEYALGGQAVTVADGKATLEDGTLAGSVLTMIQAVRNLLDWVPGLTLEHCARLASANAAAQIGLQNKGRLAPGYDADFVLLDEDLNVRATYVAGHCVYSSEASSSATA